MKAKSRRLELWFDIIGILKSCYSVHVFIYCFVLEQNWLLPDGTDNIVSDYIDRLAHALRSDDTDSDILETLQPCSAFNLWYLTLSITGVCRHYTA
jgi:hypothetical protein